MVFWASQCMRTWHPCLWSGEWTWVSLCRRPFAGMCQHLRYTLFAPGLLLYVSSVSECVVTSSGCIGKTSFPFLSIRKEESVTCVAKYSMIPWMEEPARLQSWGRKESDTSEWLHFLSFYSSFWRRKWQPTPVFLPGESHGQRGLVGYSLWGCKESDTTKQLTHTHTHIQWFPYLNPSDLTVSQSHWN